MDKDKDIVKYQFIKYIVTALSRNRINWIRKQAQIQCTEIMDENILNNQIMHFEDYIKMKMDEQLYKLIDSEEVIQYLSHIIENKELFISISKLKDEEKTILLSKTILDMTFEEISSQLSIPTSTVKSTYYRAIKKIKNSISEEEL